MHPSVTLRLPQQRFRTQLDWLDSWHSFSFGPHHDPNEVGHGLLIVANDDLVAPGGGFGEHGHRDMEIVTWVLDGQLEHRDSSGGEGVIYPGLAQRMSAGRGIRHSEMNHSATEPVHFLQMWVPPDRTDLEPGYEQIDVNDALAGGGLVPVASGRGHDGAVTLHQAHAVMWVGRLGDDEAVELPDAPYVHCFVARGTVALATPGVDGDAGPHHLVTGAAARLTSAGAATVCAVGGAAEVVVWESEVSAR